MPDRSGSLSICPGERPRSEGSSLAGNLPMMAPAKLNWSAIFHVSVVFGPKNVLMAGAATGAIVASNFRAKLAYGAICVSHSRGMSAG